MTVLKIETIAPDFCLPGVDGKIHRLTEFKNKNIVIVMFSCNHCPYVKAYEDRFIDLQTDYKNKGVILVSINSNDPSKYSEDSFENMKIRAKQKNFNFPYLRDETQNVAESYGATRTPEVFVLDQERIIRYHGRIDDNVYEPDRVYRHYLHEALDSVLEGQKVRFEDTEPVGCTIKWK